MNSFYPMSPFNVVPISRTPWGGVAISKIKQQSFSFSFPERIGESWEVSTDAQFFSNVVDSNYRDVDTLQNILTANPAHVLGELIAKQFGAHSPLLLKWLHANDVLSVQVHPNNQNTLLKASECGKPESWLVLDVESHGYIYIGFKDGLSKEDILSCLRSGNPDDCLHRYTPKPFDYVSVPTGCVHAVGPGVLIAEPQFVLPKRAGKTWRLSDWGRRYNKNGDRDDAGDLRELHLDEGQTAIDWTLPRGKQIEQTLVHNLRHSSRFCGDQFNPFATEVFAKAGSFSYQPLCNGQFSLFTVWAGNATLRASGAESIVVKAGQSVFIAANAKDVFVDTTIQGNSGVGAAMFAIQPKAFEV